MTGETHDKAMTTVETAKEAITEEMIVGIYKNAFAQSFSKELIKRLVKEHGLESSFESIKIVGEKSNVAILVEKSGKAWVIPENPPVTKYLGYYFDIAMESGNKVEYRKMFKPAVGQMKNGRFEMTEKGIIV